MMGARTGQVQHIEFVFENCCVLLFWETKLNGVIGMEGIAYISILFFILSSKRIRE